MVCTDDDDLYHLLVSIRSHGWDRDLPEEAQKNLRDKYSIDDFRALYTFYYPGFNLRSTDLQAFIGLGQMEKLDTIIEGRNQNYQRYMREIENKFWTINPPENSYISNFCFPIITENLTKLKDDLILNNIECRPLICGSINEHPFWYQRYGKKDLPNAKLVHNNGLYIPNNHQMTDSELDRIIEIVNRNI
jgi:CDP-6-deoxy-D-xylo-4-hexulose-3-dehydrase